MWLQGPLDLLLACLLLLNRVAHPWPLKGGGKPREGKPSSVTLNLFCTGKTVGCKNNMFESFRIAWVLNV